MAAYSALVSLMNTVELILNHPRPPICLDGKQIESLAEKVGFLEEFIEKYSHIGGCTELEALERLIASAAHVIEDAIDSHIVDQIQARSVSLVDLQNVVDNMDSVMEKVMEFQQERGSIKDLRPIFSSHATSSTPLNSGKGKMVGCDDELIQLMDVLTGQQKGRQTIPIVGMGGIGKTILARNVYNNLLIVQRFDIRIWVTVSPEYSLGGILLKLLSPETNSTSGLDQEPDVLGEQLYKYLYGRRYLIILDDLWSIEAWDKIKLFMPDNNNGSRIVVTTRQLNLANLFGSACLSKKFLDEDTSWNLFCEKAFAGEGGCPPELEEIGKQIARRCEGLPLSIDVMGGLLGKSTRTQEHWENIAKDINLILNSGADEQYLDILSLSYRHLPAHLKPCFLYMGIFREDDEINVTELIRLWVAEGFLKSKETQSLEKVAENHLNDLVDRNLVLVHRLGCTGNIKSCYIHDLLCLRVAVKEKFLCIMRPLDSPQGLNMERRIVFPKTVTDDLHLAAPLARSLICSRNRSC